MVENKGFQNIFKYVSVDFKNLNSAYLVFNTILLITIILPSLFSLICNPGVDSYCSDDWTMMICNQNGNGYDIVNCAQGCDWSIGKCFGFGGQNCNPTTDTMRCSGNDLQVCADQGNNQGVWQTLQTCAYGCDSQLLSCFACDKNQKPICSGNVLVTCPNGYYKNEDCSKKGLVCDAAAGACVSSQQQQTCTIGSLRCSGNDLQVCADQGNNQGVWQTLQTCAYGCDSQLLSCFACDKNQKPICSGNVLVTCPNGYYKNEDCSKKGLVCDATAGACVSSQGSQNCVDNTLRCNNNQLERCQANSWVLQDTCDPYGCYQESQTNAYCKECPYADYKECVSQTSYRVCLATFKFGSEIFCPSNYFCGYGGVCIPISGPSPGYGGGGGGGGSSTGGGSVSACKSYSDWFVNSTTRYVENGKTCTNTTYISYCVKSDGVFDKSRYKTNSSLECYEEQKQPTQPCNYIYERTENYLENVSGVCKNCTKDIFVYTCNGNKDFTKLKEAKFCSEPYVCGAQEEKPQTQDLLSTYGPIILILILLGILVGGYYLFFKPPQDQQKEQ